MSVRILKIPLQQKRKQRELKRSTENQPENRRSNMQKHKRVFWKKTKIKQRKDNSFRKQMSPGKLKPGGQNRPF